MQHKEKIMQYAYAIDFNCILILYILIIY